MRIAYLAACAAVTGVILTLGLWPFHAPRNEITWLKNKSGLKFGRHGIAIASTMFPAAPAGFEQGGAVEMWLQPRRIWDHGTFLAISMPGKPVHVAMRQSQVDLELRTAAPSVALSVADVFRKPEPVFITVTSNGQATAVYVNGIRMDTAPQRVLSAKDLTGRVVLGASPGEVDPWAGQCFGLALYNRELDPVQITRHYQTWSQKGRPEILNGEGAIALYLFDEGAGNIIHNRAGAGMDLLIPDKYTVPDHIFLRPFWQEFSVSRSYLSAAIKNIVGFVPVGFCFFPGLAAFGIKRAALVALLVGCGLSITIEVLQAYLPTRDSGTTDIITNTLGTWFGVILYRVFVNLRRTNISINARALHSVVIGRYSR